MRSTKILRDCSASARRMRAKREDFAKAIRTILRMMGALRLSGQFNNRAEALHI
jgi:hypothetical protein